MPPIWTLVWPLGFNYGICNVYYNEKKLTSCLPLLVFDVCKVKLCGNLVQHLAISYQDMFLFLTTLKSAGTKFSWGNTCYNIIFWLPFIFCCILPFKFFLLFYLILIENVVCCVGDGKIWVSRIQFKELGWIAEITRYDKRVGRKEVDLTFVFVWSDWNLLFFLSDTHMQTCTYKHKM